MKMAIIGGGGIGTLLAAEFASGGHEVAVMTTAASAWGTRITALDRNEKIVYSGDLTLVTSRLDEAVIDRDIIWVTYPTFMIPDLANELLPLVRKGQCICVIPGNDAEFFFSDHISRGVTLAGFQRVHSIARVKEKGKSVYMLGRKDAVQLATLPSQHTRQVAETVFELLRLPVHELPNYLVETLTPSNPLLHTARLRTLFADWTPGHSYGHNFLFYEDWDDRSSELLLACDDELQRLCRALESAMSLDLSQVKSLREHYDSPDARSLTTKITSIPAFKGLRSPMKAIDSDRWVPDFDSRYFRADFGFGLKAICDIAACADIDTPNLKSLYGWYLDVADSPEVLHGVPTKIGALVSLYK